MIAIYDLVGSSKFSISEPYDLRYENLTSCIQD